jgi:hypothetical protein
MFLLLACVKYPDFGAHRRSVPTQPVPGYVELDPLQPEDSAPEVAPEVLEVPPLPEPVPAVPPGLELEGSRWSLSYTAPSGEHSYDVEFSGSDILRLHNPHDTTPDNDRWRQSGAVIELTMNDGFVTYRGLFQDPGLIRGMADNGEDSWPFVLVRGARAMRVPAELDIDEAGVAALVGSSWTLVDRDPLEVEHLELTLREDGVSIDPIGDEGNSWTLSQGVLYIWVNDRHAQLSAVETEPGRWFGVGLNQEGREWAFTLEAK